MSNKTSYQLLSQIDQQHHVVEVDKESSALSISSSDSLDSLDLVIHAIEAKSDKKRVRIKRKRKRKRMPGGMQFDGLDSYEVSSNLIEIFAAFLRFN